MAKDQGAAAARSAVACRRLRHSHGGGRRSRRRWCSSLGRVSDVADLHAPAWALGGVSHVDSLDHSGERERRAVVVVEGNGAAEAGADVQAIVGGEQQRRADRDKARGALLAVDRDRDVQRAARLDLRVLRADRDRRQSGREGLLGADLRALMMNRLYS